MQYGNATHNPNKQKFFQAQRSAIVPVGMVAVVSMNTIMKKNSARTAVSLTSPPRKKPLVPITPYLPAIEMPWFNTDVPGPSDEYQPGGTGPLNQLPHPMAKPYAQKPRQPS